ncbi:DUF502 domain-containing protein [Hazenella coriacea]|uniref:Putative membrane protein n=1 Tax=Hazenella coriacea TaxID=1179467 RepID=A0A4R3LBP5_9BACL|nr:DUF502 domain-containing protein [Hazenella coriacea]TCS94936.1 putative membrane protein [Hazenella coriacea]
MKQLMRRLSITFLNGLLVLVPIAGTVYLLSYLYQLLNGLGNTWLKQFPISLDFPGMGILTVVLIVLAMGVFARLWITRQFLVALEAVIERIPFVKGLYGTLKDTIHSFIGEKKSFDTVVFVSVADSKRIGFLTVKKPIFSTEDGKEYVGVYFPQSLQVSGDLHWFEKERVEVIDLSVDEALRLVISAGVAGKKEKTPSNQRDGAET